MRMDKMTSQLQAAFADAQSLAVGRDQTSIEPEHLILSLIEQDGSSVRPMLAQAGYKLPLLKKALEDRIENFARLTSPSGLWQPLGDRRKMFFHCRKCIEDLRKLSGNPDHRADPLLSDVNPRAIDLLCRLQKHF